MKKLFTNLKVAMTLLLLCGVCSAWGDSITFNDGAGWNSDAGSQTYSDSNSGITISTSNGMYSGNYRVYKGATFTVSSTNGKITKIEVTCTVKGTAKYGPGCFALSSEGGTYEYNGDTGTWDGSSNSVVLTASSNQVRMTSITVTYTAGEDQPKLQSIYIAGTATNLSYSVGDEFNPAGLKVMGKYDKGDDKEITSGITWSFDPETLSAATTSVSVKAKVKDIESDPYTVNGLTVTAAPLSVTYDFTTNLYGHAGVSTSSSTDGNIAVDESFSEDPTEITFTKAGSTVTRFWDASNIHELRLYSGAEFKISAEGYNITKVEFTGSAINLTVDGVTVNNKTWTGKKQLVTFINSSSQSKINSIKVYYEVANPSAAIPTITPSTEADAYFDPITVTLATETAGAAIYYTTNGDEPTTTSTLYESPINVSATTTIKAIAVKDGLENSDVVSKTFTFGSTYNSLADLVAADITSGTIVKVSFEKATITNFYTNGQGKRYGVYLNIQKGGKDIEVYCNAAEHPESWVVNGTLSGALVGAWKEYNGVWEICPDSWGGLTYTAPSKQTPTITATYKKSLGIGEDDEYTVTYSGDGKLSITSSDESVAEAIIVDGEVLVDAKAAGTTTITISAPETDNYYAVSETYILNVVGPATLPFVYDEGKGGLSAGMTQNGLGTDYNSSPKLKFDSTGDNLVIWYGEQASFVSYDIKGNSFKDGTFQVMESADGVTYTVVATHTGLGSTVTTLGNTLKSDSRYVKFVYTEKKEGNVALGNICVNKPITITDAGYATAYLPFAATVEGATAYYVTVDGDYAKLNEINGTIPANTGVVLKGEAGTVTFTESAETPASVDGNLLIGTAVAEGAVYDAANTTYYILSTGSNGVGFYWDPASIAGEKANCAQYKAVLAVSNTNGAAPRFISFDEATGIEAIHSVNENENIYNLNGVRVNGNYKGIVIINGKKVVK